MNFFTKNLNKKNFFRGGGWGGGGCIFLCLEGGVRWLD